MIYRGEGAQEKIVLPSLSIVDEPTETVAANIRESPKMTPVVTAICPMRLNQPVIQDVNPFAFSVLRRADQKYKLQYRLKREISTHYFIINYLPSRSRECGADFSHC